MKNSPEKELIWAVIKQAFEDLDNKPVLISNLLNKKLTSYDRTILYRHIDHYNSALYFFKEIIEKDTLTYKFFIKNYSNFKYLLPVVCVDCGYISIFLYDKEDDIYKIINKNNFNLLIKNNKKTCLNCDGFTFSIPFRRGRDKKGGDKNVEPISSRKEK